MQKTIFPVIIFLLYQLNGYGQQALKKETYPLQDILNHTDTVLFRGSPSNNRGIRLDTLFQPFIKKLSQQSFRNRHIRTEQYGVTPDGAITLYANGKTIALVSCWDISATEYAVNIRINDKRSYYGLTIRKQVLNRYFVRK